MAGIVEKRSVVGMRLSQSLIGCRSAFCLLVF
jgi:hypothetical protein